MALWIGYESVCRIFFSYVKILSMAFAICSKSFAESS